jgi:isopentenyl-diphosphate Delta-isomerase
MNPPKSEAQNLDELFDVVDEQDRVIGQATRREVHAKGLKHRAVHVLVFNGQGQVFLHKRSMLKDSAPGLWGASCAGHLDAGENYDQAALRELKEELGISVDEAPCAGCASAPARKPPRNLSGSTK